MSEFNVLEHELVPVFSVLSETETEKLLKTYNINLERLPKINAGDPCVKAIQAKPGQVVKIIRKSQTAGESVVYRLVKK